MEIISPKYDWCMKELFENETILKHFVCAVLDLPVESVKSIRVRNPFLWRRSRFQKLGILDVLAELNDDARINIELQVRPVKYWDRRELFYLAKMYTADMRSGEEYGRARRCVGISILDFNLSDREEYHSVYRLRDRNGNEFTDMLELHIIELNKKLQGRDRADDWVRLFKAETEEDLRMIRTKDRGIREAIKQLRQYSLGERVRAEYEARQKLRRDIHAREQYVREEGIEEGVRQGIQQGIQKSILDLLEEFGACPEELRERILRETDIEVLSQWHKSAAKADSIENFQESIGRR